MPASRVMAELRAATAAARQVRLAPAGWGHPVRAAACMAVPLSAGVIAGHASYGMVASLGALAGLYGQAEPYRRRALVHAVVALALALAAVAGTLVAPSAIAAVVVVGAIATVATFTCLVLEVGPPREHMMVLVALMTATLPLAPGGALELGGLVLAGGAIAWLIALSGWLADRSRPERTATANALDAVAALLDAIAADAPSLRVARHQAALAARVATHAVAFASGRSATTLQAVQLEVDELLDAVVGADVLQVPIDPAWARDARALAAIVRTGSGGGGGLPPQGPAGARTPGSPLSGQTRIAGSRRQRGWSRRGRGSPRRWRGGPRPSPVAPRPTPRPPRRDGVFCCATRSPSPPPCAPGSRSPSHWPSGTCCASASPTGSR